MLNLPTKEKRVFVCGKYRGSLLFNYTFCCGLYVTRRFALRSLTKFNRLVKLTVKIMITTARWRFDEDGCNVRKRQRHIVSLFKRKCNSRFWQKRQMAVPQEVSFYMTVMRDTWLSAALVDSRKK